MLSQLDSQELAQVTSLVEELVDDEDDYADDPTQFASVEDSADESALAEASDVSDNSESGDEANFSEVENYED